MLQKANFRVITASNADEALYLVRNQERIDFLLTEVNRVGGSITGIELAELVRHENPGTKVLLMSGRPESLDLAAERGLPIVRKPFVPTVLIQRIREMLAEIPAQHPKNEKMVG
jgi:DNA-binding response OmpR family regulator